MKDTRGDPGGAPGADSAPGSQTVASGDQKSRDLPGERPSVLVVGTSLTAGLGLDPYDAYPAVIQRKADSAGYKVHVVNAGLSGETSAGALRRIDWLMREPAAVVVIETGANDGLRGLDPDSTKDNLVAIVRKVKAAQPKAQILLAQMEAPPNLGASYTNRFRDMFASVAASEGIGLIPFLLKDVAGVRRMNQGDGIHPNREGAQVVAANLWPSLVPLLERVNAEP